MPSWRWAIDTQLILRHWWKEKNGSASVAMQQQTDGQLCYWSVDRGHMKVERAEKSQRWDTSMRWMQLIQVWVWRGETVLYTIAFYSCFTSCNTGSLGWGCAHWQRQEGEMHCHSAAWDKGGRKKRGDGAKGGEKIAHKNVSSLLETVTLQWTVRCPNWLRWQRLNAWFNCGLS